VLKPLWLQEYFWWGILGTLSSNSWHLSVAMASNTPTADVPKPVAPPAGAPNGSTPAEEENPTSKSVISQTEIPDIATMFKTSIEKGLSSEEAEARFKRDGPNQLTQAPKPTLLMLFLMQMTSFIIILLCIAAIASVVVNATGSKKNEPLSYTTAVAIFIIVVINAGIAAWSEHKADDALAALMKMTQPTIKVLRDGEKIDIQVVTMAVGDVVILDTGDVVPSDIRLIEAHDIKVKEMNLTGEPDDVAKTWKIKPKKEGEVATLTPANMVFSGCSITSGNGRGISIAIGMNTEIGKIASDIEGGDKSAGKTKCFCLPDTSGSETPLQQDLGKLGKNIGIIAIVVCVVIFIIGTVLERKDPSNKDSPAWIYMILIAVTLAVAAIPEGIPLCVTISLSIGCKQMIDQQVLVRKLPAVETLGSSSIICSDKTGTLTEGKMRMVHMWTAGASYNISGKGFIPEGEIENTKYPGKDAKQDMGIKSTLLAGMLCSNATVLQVEDEKTKALTWTPFGNSSEAPIIVAGMKVGFDKEKMKSEYERVLEVPFSSSRKMMLTLSEVRGSRLCENGAELSEGTQYMAVCKGAPNYIIQLCTHQLMADGKQQAMTQSMKDQLLEVVDEYSSQALRVLAVATCGFKQLPFDKTNDEITIDQKFSDCTQSLCLYGLFASMDPHRTGVPEAIADARGAGIRVVMITGDYLKTAIAIAKNINLITADDKVEEAALDCEKLRPGNKYLKTEDMDALTSTIRVFARARPEDKLEIVKSLQNQNYVTAMTGDGVNDAPALSQADIGVAMGIQGTEVAKGASDMVLTDDNFCNIVKAVEKGRAIYSGIQKFVAFIMSVHIAEVMQIFFCIVTGIPVMRTPLQILFLILVTDLPPSIALGMEPGESNILQQKPRPKTEPVVLMWMWVSMVLNGAVLSIVIIALYIVALVVYADGAITSEELDRMDPIKSEENLMDAQTVAFIGLVFSENIRSYCSRSFDRCVFINFLGNVEMQKAIILAQLCLLAAVLIPGFSEDVLGLRGVDIGIKGWALSLAGPFGTLILCESCKLITGLQMRSYQQQLAAKQAQSTPPRTAESTTVKVQTI